jgi:hypothetical protein
MPTIAYEGKLTPKQQAALESAREKAKKGQLFASHKNKNRSIGAIFSDQTSKPTRSHVHA